MSAYLNKEEKKALFDLHGNICDHCRQPHGNLHAHHTNYSEKPVSVLCPSCHQHLHHPPKTYESKLTQQVLERIQNILDEDEFMDEAAIERRAAERAASQEQTA